MAALWPGRRKKDVAARGLALKEDGRPLAWQKKKDVAARGLALKEDGTPFGLAEEKRCGQAHTALSELLSPRRAERLSLLSSL